MTVSRFSDADPRCGHGLLTVTPVRLRLMGGSKLGVCSLTSSRETLAFVNAGKPKQVTSSFLASGVRAVASVVSAPARYVNMGSSTASVRHLQVAFRAGKTFPYKARVEQVVFFLTVAVSFLATTPAVVLCAHGGEDGSGAPYPVFPGTPASPSFLAGEWMALGGGMSRFTKIVQQMPPPVVQRLFYRSQLSPAVQVIVQKNGHIEGGDSDSLPHRVAGLGLLLNAIGATRGTAAFGPNVLKASEEVYYATKGFLGLLASALSTGSVHALSRAVLQVFPSTRDAVTGFLFLVDAVESPERGPLDGSLHFLYQVACDLKELDSQLGSLVQSAVPGRIRIIVPLSHAAKASAGGVAVSGGKTRPTTSRRSTRLSSGKKWGLAGLVVGALIAALVMRKLWPSGSGGSVAQPQEPGDGGQRRPPPGPSQSPPPPYSPPMYPDISAFHTSSGPWGPEFPIPFGVNPATGAFSPGSRPGAEPSAPPAPPGFYGHGKQ